MQLLDYWRVWLLPISDKQNSPSELPKKHGAFSEIRNFHTFVSTAVTDFVVG